MASALHHLKRFHKDQSGAVAATYALALLPLIAMAGLGFDYARMAGMDSELQNAADQAALAAATQLDGNTGACARAGNAAINLVQNDTIMADGNNAISVGAVVDPNAANLCSAFSKIRFFETYTSRTSFTLATSDANANYVEVTIDGRKTTFSLVAAVGAQPADGLALAVAGLGSAICKVPPVMMCNPNESSDPNFNIANYVGKGIRLVANVNGQNGAGEDPDEPVGSYGPGVFGYLETNAGNGAIATARTLGRQSFEGDCVAITGADVKPGQQVSVLDALNTRFGIYDNGLNNVCENNNSACPPSGNSRIDLVKKGGNGGSCRIHTSGFQVGDNPYRPTSATANIDPTGIQPMGYPRDKCHAVSLAGACSGNGNARVGNGDWDIDAYYATNGYTAVSKATVAANTYGYTELGGRSTPTRYQQYRYEYTNAGAMLLPRSAGGGNDLQGTPLCNGPGVAPASTPDRRVLSIAVINCTAENVGANTTDADIIKWVDVFLVEPTARRVAPDGTRYTNNSDVYVEVIGATTVGGGANEGQEIRKDVPYLIE